jgi:hypothetical protein
MSARIKCGWCRCWTWEHKNDDGKMGSLWGYCSSTCKDHMANSAPGYAVRIEQDGPRDAFTGARDSNNVRAYLRAMSGKTNE